MNFEVVDKIWVVKLCGSEDLVKQQLHVERFKNSPYRNIVSRLQQTGCRLARGDHIEICVR